MTTILTAPKVTLIAWPTFKEPDHLSCEWEGEWNDPGEALVEFAGRVCYMSYHNPAKRTTEEYITNLHKQGHGSVLEHANYSLLLEGISRSCSHELVRHRAGMAYSQLSQRYVDSSDVAFVLPPAYEGDAELIADFTEFCTVAVHFYEYIVRAQLAKFAHIENVTERRKVARESARAILPNATETKMVVTGNARAWRHVLTMRCGEGAEREIRRLGLVILQELTAQAPFFFKDIEPYQLADGSYAARPTYYKV